MQTATGRGAQDFSWILNFYGDVLRYDLLDVELHRILVIF